MLFSIMYFILKLWNFANVKKDMKQEIAETSHA